MNPRHTRQTLKRKLTHNNKGVSIFWTTILLLVLFVILWEVAGQLTGVFKPSDFFTPSGDIEGELETLDRVTGTRTTMKEGGILFGIVQETGHTYNLILHTNAPFKLVGDPYKMVYTYYNEDYYWSEFHDAGNITAISKAMPINALWQNSFTVSCNSSYQYNTKIDFRLYDPLGFELYYWKVELTHAAGQGNFP